jgi:hypothetical protein
VNLLQLVQAAAGELGIARPAFVAASQDLGVVQLLSLANSLGRQLARDYQWEALCTEYRFTTQYLTTTGTLTEGSAVVTGIPSTTGLDTTYMVVGTGALQDTYVQSVDSLTQVTMSNAATAPGTVTLNFCKTKYAMPSDYDRPIDRTQWDKSKHWEMQGPQSPQEWQWLKSGYISVAPQLRFRPLGGFFQTWPPISTPELLGMEYVSNAWARALAGTGKSCFSADTDTCVFPDDLMVLGLKVKYTQAKGFPGQYDNEYRAALSIAKANDAGSKTLSMGARRANQLIGFDNIPPTGYGGVNG